MHDIGSAMEPETLSSFGRLAACGKVPDTKEPGHLDGWGFAAFKDGALALHERVPAPAIAISGLSSKFTDVAGRITREQPHVVIGHLRKASRGNRKLENTHPFALNGWAFCHNGAMQETDRFVLEEPWIRKRRGETDSEMIFLYFLQSLEKTRNTSHANVREAVLETVRAAIRGSDDYTALNIVLTDGNVLYVVREVNERNANVRRLNLCNDYYTLYIGANEDNSRLLICSETLSVPGITWQIMENQTVLEASRRGGRIIRQIFPL